MKKLILTISRTGEKTTEPLSVEELFGSLSVLFASLHDTFPDMWLGLTELRVEGGQIHVSLVPTGPVTPERWEQVCEVATSTMTQGGDQ